MRGQAFVTFPSVDLAHNALVRVIIISIELIVDNQLFTCANHLALGIGFYLLHQIPFQSLKT